MMDGNLMPGKGRWFVSYGDESTAGQISKQVNISERETTKTVTIKDVDFR